MAFIPKPRQSDEDNNASMQQGGNGQWQKGPTAFNRPPPPASRGPGLSTAKAPGRLPQRSNAPSMSGNPNSPMAGGGDFGRFVSLGEYLGQNQSQAQGMANKVGNAGEAAGQGAQKQIDKLETSFNRGLQNADKSRYGQNASSAPGESIEKANPSGYEAASNAAQNASDYNKNLGTTSGVQENMRSVYGAKGQSSGEGMWDAAQAGQAGGGRFAQLASRYSNLGQSLTDANTRSATAFSSLQERNKKWDTEEEARRREAESIKRINDTNAAAMSAPSQGAVARNEKVNAYRQEDARRKEEKGSGYMTREDWANLHGMTLEQWVANGENPPF